MTSEEYAKRCSRCGEVKPASSYYRARRNNDGLYSHCKRCHRSYVIEQSRNQRRHRGKGATEE